MSDNKRLPLIGPCVAVRLIEMELQKAEKRLKLKTEDYAKLAEFRLLLRTFLRFSEVAAAAEGLTSQHYQAMLVLRGWSGHDVPTINDLSRELLIKHNSAVGLVDRLVEGGLARRERSRVDGRKVEIHLTRQGRDVLARLAAVHRRELTQIGPVLSQFFAELSSESWSAH